jgi:hypothetical protein
MAMPCLDEKLRRQNLWFKGEEELCTLLPDARVAGGIKNKIGSILLERPNVSTVSLRAVAEYCSSQKLVRLAEERLVALGVEL